MIFPDEQKMLEAADKIGSNFQMMKKDEGRKLDKIWNMKLG